MTSGKTTQSLAADSYRIVSLDQFRGYTVLGMFLVNFVGSFAVIGQVLPVLKHHHTYCSYADTIMPQFLFAVGFAFRLTLLRRLAAGDGWKAYARALRRNLGLVLIAFVIYPLGGDGLRAWSEATSSKVGQVLLVEFKRELFQTLTHIAVTAIWVMPVIAARPSVRVAYAIFSGMLHLALSYSFNYTWVNTDPRGIDGGPLGFLTWSIPLLAGSLAYDAWMAGRFTAIRKCLVWGLLLMILGYGLSCLVLPPEMAPDAGPTRDPALEVQLASPPFFYVEQRPPDNNLFTMSQRSGSITYLIFGAGFSLALYALFIAACDVGGWQLGIFRTLGVNALAGYILHGLVSEAIKPFVPKDSPGWYVFIALCVFLAICYVMLRYLEKNRLFFRM